MCSIYLMRWLISISVFYTTILSSKIIPWSLILYDKYKIYLEAASPTDHHSLIPGQTSIKVLTAFIQARSELTGVLISWLAKRKIALIMLDCFSSYSARVRSSSDLLRASSMARSCCNMWFSASRRLRSDFMCSWIWVISLAFIISSFESPI